ncbi:MAG: glutamine-hydrolyzing GMP synthase [Candidatus Cloacimonadota bacterium]|nr:MAG: glutamine-hydrolyzing GMP synthase [Candidatus Cloacimonadota bacterium]
MIAILDFGGQYAHLIATRFRSFGVFTQIYDSDISIDKLDSVKGIVLSGGPQSVFSDDSLKIDSKIFKMKIPTLAICFGHQITSHTLGGIVSKGVKGEYGPALLRVEKESLIFKDVSLESKVWMSHFDEVTKIPNNFEIIASTKDCQIAAMQNKDLNIYGIQFHPEVIHTKEGLKILSNFADICEVKNTWDLGSFIDKECLKIREKVKDKKVFLLVSGGVDSSVAFALLEKALGKERVFGVFMDTGLLRKDERKYVESSMKEAGFENLYTEICEDIFLKNLEKKFLPEEKRKIIGNTFLDVQKEIVKRLGLNPEDWLLGQGTIYPDTIESGATKNSHTIKTHHNRVPEIQKMIDEGKVIEPLVDLYKDEVREVGRKLGLSNKLVDRHPFPGPGLGVRILCSNENDLTIIEEGEVNNFKYQILPIKSVGVQGDQRTYKHPAVLYLNNDRLDWDKLDQSSVKIVNESDNVNRVVLSLSSKVLQKFKSKEKYIDKNRIKLLQEVDFIAQKILYDYELKALDVQKVWQFPVVLLPLVNEKNEECVVLRPIWSQEAMTAEFARLPQEILNQMSEKILEIDGIGEVFYDLTHKPPGTIEWE